MAPLKCAQTHVSLTVCFLAQVRLPMSETKPVECGWAPQGPRIVSHQGQGGMQMAGNGKTTTRPKPAYSRNDTGGHYTS